MTEPHETRLKRLRLRSWRRGTREMDLLLGGFADGALAELDAASLDAYEALMAENDHELYAWISGKKPVDADHHDMVLRVQAFHGIEGPAGPGKN